MDHRICVILSGRFCRLGFFLKKKTAMTNNETSLLRCPSCGQKLTLVTGKKLHPYTIEAWKKYFWMCCECLMWVGCHPNSKKPLGTVADYELRQLRIECHDLIDPLWKSRQIERRELYDKLSKFLQLPIEETHIGLFDKKTCKFLLKKKNKFLQSLK